MVLQTTKKAFISVLINPFKYLHDTSNMYLNFLYHTVMFYEIHPLYLFTLFSTYTVYIFSLSQYVNT